MAKHNICHIGQIPTLELYNPYSGKSVFRFVTY